MSKLPETRQELRDWALRKLGAPVLQINLDEDQIEDMITEALCSFQEYHFDGVEHMWLKHQITASQFFYDSAMSVELLEGTQLKGLTSDAIARHYDQAEDNLSSRFTTIEGTFQDGEIIEVVNGEHTGVQFQLQSSDSIFIGDVDNEYIPVPDYILYITKVLPLTGRSSGGIVFGSVFTLGNGPNAVDLRNLYQHMYDLNGFDLITYDMFKRHLALIEFEFGAIKGMHFNRVTDKVQLDIDWDENLIDKYIIFEAYRTLNPSDYPQIYRDKWMRWYLVALLKYQWAWNLLKYEGKELPGGVSVNASAMLAEAKEEISKLELQLETKFQLPPMFEVG